MKNKIKVRYVSSWEEGLVETDAMLDLESGRIYDIETADGESSEYECLIKEYIMADRMTEIDVKSGDDNEYYVSNPDDLTRLRKEFGFKATSRKP